MKRVLIASPHLDDAVLSCGQYLAGRPDAVVMTIFAGTPQAETVTTAYDQQCGFGAALEATTSRIEEDKLALAVLGCTECHLPFTDQQYGETNDFKDIVASIRHAIEKLDPEYVVGPLGLIHPDHQTTRDALLEVARGEGFDIPVWLYEDLPGAMLDPDEPGRALATIRAAGFDLERGFIGDGPRWKKMLAVQAYRSQVGLFNTFDIYVTERFWKVSRSDGDERD
jgi:LmbE family N-acetylglucosaminyl deacetylase